MLAHFDIDALRVEPLGDAGRAWRIWTDGRDLVLRLYPPSRSADLLATDVATLGFLEGAAYRAPRPLRGRDGETVIAVGRDHGYVTTFIEGSTIEIDVATAYGIGALVGWLHSLDVTRATLAETTFSVRRVRDTFTHQAQDPIICALDGWDVIERPAAKAWKRMSTLDDLPRTLIHTDVHAGNIVCCRDGALALVDWDDAGIGPAVIDLAIFLVHSGLPHAEVTHGRYEWHDDVAATFMGGYAEHRTLSTAEWAALPDGLRFAALAYLVHGWVPAIAMLNWRRFEYIETHLTEIMACLVR